MEKSSSHLEHDGAPATSFGPYSGHDKLPGIRHIIAIGAARAVSASRQWPQPGTGDWPDADTCGGQWWRNT